MTTDGSLNTCADCGSTEKKLAAPIKVQGEVVVLCTDCFKVRASTGFKKAATHVQAIPKDPKDINHEGE
jgi:ribosome-binding protein aMBF1 (putative translation factor)